MSYITYLKIEQKCLLVTNSSAVLQLKIRNSYVEGVENAYCVLCRGRCDTYFTKL
jgi:hypothetical protein